MNTSIVANEPIVNFQVVPSILIIRTFDRKGEWQLEVIYAGGHKVTGKLTEDEVTQIESDLYDRGWQIEYHPEVSPEFIEGPVEGPSLYSNGFNAKPGHGLGRWWAMRGDAVAIAEDDTFVSGIEWPEDGYALELPL